MNNQLKAQMEAAQQLNEHLYGSEQPLIVDYDGFWHTAKGVDEITGKEVYFSRIPANKHITYQDGILEVMWIADEPVTNTEAQNDVKELQAKWREKGWDKLADLFDYEDDENVPLVDQLIEMRKVAKHLRIKDPQFLRYNFDAVMSGLAFHLNAPRSFVPIKNLECFVKEIETE